MAINLLPQEEIQELLLGQKQKKIFWILVFAFIFLILLMVFFLLLDLYIDGKINTQQGIVLEKEKELKDAGFKDIRLMVAEINEDLSKVNQVQNSRLAMVSLLEKIIVLIPDSIFLTDFSFKQEVDDTQKNKSSAKEKSVFTVINMSGVAPDRQTLFLLKKELDTNSQFKDVYFLPSSWVKSSNVNFTVEFKFIPN